MNIATTNNQASDAPGQDIRWDLSDLYQSSADPALGIDIAACAEQALQLEELYKTKVPGLDAGGILTLVKSLESLATRLGRVTTYCYLNFATQTQDQPAAALWQRAKEAASAVGARTIFFELEWNTIAPERAREFLDSPILTPYRHYLADMRKYAPHQLSKEEEVLLLELAPVGRSSWTGLFDKVMGRLRFGERRRTIEEVLADLYHADRPVRMQAAQDLTAGIRTQDHVFTHLFNTLLAEKMILDRRRRYDSWLSAMDLANELRGETVAALINAVTSRYDIVQRYYRLKARVLDLDVMYDYDRYAPLPHLPTLPVSWPDAREMVIGAFDAFSPDLARIAELFFERRWIDAPVVPGKRSGAFAHPGVPEIHPYIMLNYTGNLRDVSTLAHELGHGIHQHLAAALGYFNSKTPLVLAETASVFAELLLFNAQLAKLGSPEERRAFTCQKLESIFATVFRQVAMNRFEDRVHRERRDKGELGTEAISNHWLATQNDMFAGSVTLTEDYGLWWSYIPHFLNVPGYVYSYAFGELLVLALYDLYQRQGKAFVTNYIELLKAGGNASPYELVMPFGVKLDDPEFWHGGLKTIDAMLAAVE